MILIEENDDRFYIAKSTIDNSGKGLFAKEFIKKGDYLEVIGIIVRNGSISDTCTEYAKHYKFAVNEKNDACIIPLGYAGIVNHTDDKNLQNVFLSYSMSRIKKHPHAGQCVYEAIRDIQKDEEILGNYGESIGNLLNWTKKQQEFYDVNQDAWQKFISYDLYNLGILNNLR